MQNKPNFPKSQMNVNPYNTTDYENKSNWTIGQNKPNSNPIKPNLPKGKIDAKCVFTKDYEEKCGYWPQKNKAKTNPISETAKMNANAFSQKDYENETALRPKKTNPIQTQSRNNTRAGWAKYNRVNPQDRQPQVKPFDFAQDEEKN